MSEKKLYRKSMLVNLDAINDETYLDFVNEIINEFLPTGATMSKVEFNVGVMDYKDEFMVFPNFVVFKKISPISGKRLPDDVGELVFMYRV